MDIMDNNVLYIDDEEVNLTLFEASFSKHFKVHLASSTKEAERLMENKQFKVVVSDISMPYETGLHFFKRIQFSDIEPIFIILTAHLTNNLLLDALNQGRIFRYLTKPWNYGEVKFTIDQAIQVFDLHYNNRQLYLETIESKQNFYNIFQSSQDGIVIFDNNGVVLEVNDAFLKIINKQVSNILGSKLSDNVPDSLRENLSESIHKLIQSTASVKEYDYVSSKEGRKTVELNSNIIEYKGERAVMSIVRDITERKYNEKKILNAVIQAEERERSRIAKDLHDGLGPIMATLKMYLEWLNDQKQIQEHPDILNLSLNSINEAIITLKNISNNLSPHILEKFGLYSALTAYIDKVKKIKSIKFEVSVKITERLVLATEMSLYRVLTECISNSIRHSNATEINLTLWKEGKTLRFLYKDNGKGFDVSEVFESNTGMGLHNMKNRIKTLGGEIDIQSWPDNGIVIESKIPIN
jgi:PAS domain S-box-containing protein